ncbi:MAG: substrate-binding domain-containing protein [Candidatus Atribacteria bacterium]|nr:substrate-binding domain-containing protein [Candidatus Atribacteria bacterium]
MKKNWVIFLIITVFLVSVTSLAFGQEKKPAEGMYFRLVTHGGDDPFWAVVQQGMLDAAKELGCQVDIDLAGSDLALQQKRFAEAVAQKPNGIALVINDDTAWDKPVEEALAAGIPVIGINNDDSRGPAGNKRLCYIGQSEERAGYMIGLRLFQEAKEKGIDLTKAHVAMPVEVPGANYGVLRSNCIKRAAEEFGIASFEIVDAGGLEMTTAEQRETSYLLAHPETTFMIGLGAIATDRLTDSLKNAGKEPGEVIAGGFDTTAATLNGLREGYITATIDQQQYLQGYYAVNVLYLYNKYGFTPNIDTGGYLVDSIEKIDMIEKLSPLHVR